MTSKYCLNALDDTGLVVALKKLTISDHELTAEVVAHIAEVDARRLYLEEACSSMYTYASEVLGMDEGVAYKRIHAARAARRYPRIFDMLASGELHLSGVTLLAPVLTAENHDALLSLAAHKSKREIEKLVAERFPSPDVPSVVRKLPAPKASAQQPPATAAGQEVPSQPVASFDVDETAQQGLLQSAAPPPAPAPAPLAPPKTPPLVKPVSPGRYKVQLTASEVCYNKLREAQSVLRHPIPNGDIAAVIEKALTLLVEDVKQRRFGIPRRGRKARKRSKKEQPSMKAAPDVQPKRSGASCGRMEDDASSHQASPGAAQRGGASVTAEVSPHSPNDTTASSLGGLGEGYATDQSRDRTGAKKSRSRYIPAHVRRQVVERDGGRCSFVDANGRRCTETGGLEFHHVIAFAKGGEHTASGIKLFCGAHNGYEAIKDFGEAFIESHKERAKERRVSTSRAALPSDERAFPGESKQAQLLFHRTLEGISDTGVEVDS